ncbi:MAG TPA: hemerythrin domain-containing protein [Vineibacter sp.]|nr:hemerythrin domain-containing protein [Vineibacter sp.]
MVTNPAHAASDPRTLAEALRAGKKVGPDAINLLIQDHREVMTLFEAYDEETDSAVKLALARRICMDLRVHMAFEEELFYTASRQVVDEEEIVDDAYDEHDEAKSLISKIEERTSADATLTRNIRALRTAIEQHVTIEETDLFPKVRASALDLWDLGVPMVVRRAELFAEETVKPLPAPGRKKDPDPMSREP